MAEQREERMLQRRRGAGRHVVEQTADFDLFGEPSSADDGILDEAQTNGDAQHVPSEHAPGSEDTTAPVPTRTIPNSKAKRKRLEAMENAESEAQSEAQPEAQPALVPPEKSPSSQQAGQPQTQEFERAHDERNKIPISREARRNAALRIAQLLPTPPRAASLAGVINLTDEVGESPADAPGSGQRRSVSINEAAESSARLHQMMSQEEIALAVPSSSPTVRKVRRSLDSAVANHQAISQPENQQQSEAANLEVEEADTVSPLPNVASRRRPPAAASQRRSSRSSEASRAESGRSLRSSSSPQTTASPANKQILEIVLPASSSPLSQRSDRPGASVVAEGTRKRAGRPATTLREEETQVEEEVTRPAASTNEDVPVNGEDGVLPKKGRGRPRKGQDVVATDPEEVASETPSSSASRRSTRGRPADQQTQGLPQQPAVATDDLDGTSAEQPTTATAAGGRRGRPPKQRPQEVLQLSVAADTNIGEAPTEKATKAAETGGRRGRPAKQRTQEVSQHPVAADDNIDDASTQKAAKAATVGSKRGRPAKNQSQQALQQPAAEENATDEASLVRPAKATSVGGKRGRPAKGSQQKAAAAAAAVDGATPARSTRAAAVAAEPEPPIEQAPQASKKQQKTTAARDEPAQESEIETTTNTQVAARQLGRKRTRANLEEASEAVESQERPARDEPSSKRQRRPARASPAQQEQPAARNAKANAEVDKRQKRAPKKKGAADDDIHVAVQRFTRRAPSKAQRFTEPDELSFNIPYAKRGGPSIVDAVAQACQEIIDLMLHKLREAMVEVEDVQERQRFRNQIRVVEDYKRQLEGRFLEHTIALDHVYSLKRRVRAAQKERNELRKALLKVRADRDQTVLRMDAVRLQHQKDKNEATDYLRISSTMHSVDLAIEQSKHRPDLSAKEQKTAELVNLELRVNQVADQACTNSGQGGMLHQAKSFNSFLERALALLDTR